jgi:pyruvate dehydrogenase E1 component alpha subunit
MKAYTLDGMDFFNCYAGFKQIHREVLETHRPVLVEAVTERFRGHSISDPGLYRSKEDLKECMQRDPLLLYHNELVKAKIIDDETYKKIDKECREIVMAAMKYADESPWPELTTLEEDVYAPEDV